MAHYKNILKLTAAGLVGWVGGSIYERYKPFNVNVYAATQLPMLPPSEPAPNASRSSQIMRFGFPSTDSVRMYDDYILSYDRRNKTANWVFEHLTIASVTPNDKVERSKSEFIEDTSVHHYFRALNSDYSRSGYDRGHLAAAGNHRLCQEHLNQTFVLSNISPQVGKGFNRDIWNNLERYTRNLTKSYRNVYVCTGPLYLPRREGDGKTYIRYEVIGANHVAVPTHFFKIIVAESQNREFHLESYVLPNIAIDNSVPLTTFHVPLESIERASGLLFFDKLPHQMFKSINHTKT